MPFGLWSKSSSGVSSASSSSGSQHHHRHHTSKTHRHERSKSYSAASASSSEEAAGKVKTVVESSEHEGAEDDAVLARIDPKAKAGSKWKNINGTNDSRIKSVSSIEVTFVYIFIGREDSVIASGTLVDSDSDGCYEKEYLDSLKHKSNRASKRAPFCWDYKQLGLRLCGWRGDRCSSCSWNIRGTNGHPITSHPIVLHLPYLFLNAPSRYNDGNSNGLIVITMDDAASSNSHLMLLGLSSWLYKSNRYLHHLWP